MEMLVKLCTTINDIYTIPNRENQNFVKEFYEFMKNYNTFEKYQNNNLKAIIAIAKFLDLSLSFFIFFYSITKRERII
jgi:ABC-type antimicrobial peptide transport system permease subunit